MLNLYNKKKEKVKIANNGQPSKKILAQSIWRAVRVPQELGNGGCFGEAVLPHMAVLPKFPLLKLLSCQMVSFEGRPDKT